MQLERPCFRHAVSFPASYYESRNSVTVRKWGDHPQPVLDSMQPILRSGGKKGVKGTKFSVILLMFFGFSVWFIACDEISAARLFSRTMNF